MQVVALCLLTAVFEEGVFRVLALDAFAPALGGGRRGMLRAALVSAVLFGALHVSLGEAASAVQAADFVAVAQTACKPVQAALFGLFMAAMYFGTRNLWTLVAVHAAFNFLYAGPQLLAGNLQQTYVTGDPIRLRSACCLDGASGSRGLVGAATLSEKFKERVISPCHDP